MAKNLQIPEKKPSKIWEIISTEYKAEGIILAIAGGLVALMGVYLVEGVNSPSTAVFTITLTHWWIFNSDMKILIFSISLIVIGVGIFISQIWPFFVPSIAEMKKVTWPNRTMILNHTARVFGFIFLISFFFILADYGLRPLFEWIKALGV